MAVKFRAVAQLPPLPATPDAADIDHLKVALTVDGAPADPPSQDLPRDAAEFDAGLYDAGQSLSLSLVYVDAVGNESVHPATADVVIADETAPPDPGAFGFRTMQEFTADEGEAPPAA